MKTKTIISTILILTSFSSFGQFSRQKIETDSSNIEIIRNSVYHIYEEAYKNKDSVWYSVHFIKDTTRLNTEGWRTKDDKYLGVWKEYNFDKELMYIRDYDNATCEINKDLYPFYDLLEKMKLKADSLIISTYSKEFFERHVRFDFNCATYDQEGYVGSWVEPIERKPTKFLFRYQVKLNASECYDEMIGIELDENGEYIPNEGFWNNYGFEMVNSNSKTFKIDKNKAIEIAKSKGLQTNDLSKVSEFLKWEKFKKPEFYNGQFRYYITEFTDEIKDIKTKGRSRIIYKYNVYSFDPWTGEFIEKKRMKRVREWGKK
ncbi:hypothetical protein J0X14_04215 [Muricauda sp. CAU 1633]|uniref:hypothetical protein n=1 Tax=Allomuricauda sp. CAU 1633 TaxID=2816036 RepID=UPI001A901755|nr:hypothetical protein [Muricauda sp. CAU 1633]MBO0321492.1 hypothetical protein [Muricauda sp. CAU 1633]